MKFDDLISQTSKRNHETNINCDMILFLVCHSNTSHKHPTICKRGSKGNTIKNIEVIPAKGFKIKLKMFKFFRCPAIMYGDVVARDLSKRPAAKFLIRINNLSIIFERVFF